MADQRAEHTCTAECAHTVVIPRCSGEMDHGDNLFHPCSGACDTLGCWYRRD